MDVINSHIEQMNNGTHAEQAHTTLHPDVVFISGAGQEMHGRDAFVAANLAFLQMLPDVQCELLGYEGDANAGMVSMRMEGHFTGEMKTPNGTIPGNGNHAVWEPQAEVEFTDGLISYWKTILDMQDFMRQIGVG